MRAAPIACVLLALHLPSAGPAEAQERVCDIVESGRIEGYGTGETSTVVLHDPFLVRCSDGAELRAQRGTLNQAIRELHLVGQVFFQDSARTLTSDEATYASQLGRLWARGNVVFENRAEGSTLRGPELEYFQAGETRPTSQVIAIGRPHLTLRSRAAEGEAEEEPLELDADQVVIVGENQLTATGSVVVTRSDLTATGREVRYDEATDELELRGDALVVSEEYRLSGQLVRARLPEGGLEYVSAETGSELRSDDLTLTAPSIQLFFADDLLHRTVARGREGEGEGEGAARAVALAESFRLEADSLDAVLPGQQLQQVVAVGRAVGERFDTTGVAPPDSTAAPEARAPIAERTGLSLVDHDWIRGDTVIGVFEPADSADAAAGDSAVVLKTMVARGAAQSLYRMERRNEEGPADATAPGHSINFLSGDTITLHLVAGEVDEAEVEGVRRGLYLEPAPPSEEDAPADAPADAPPGGVPAGSPDAGSVPP